MARRLAPAFLLAGALLLILASFVPMPYRAIVGAGVIGALVLVLPVVATLGCLAGLRAAIRGGRKARPTPQVDPVDGHYADADTTAARYVGRAQVPARAIYIPPTDDEHLAALDRDLFPHINAAYVSRLSELYLIPGEDFRC